MSKPIHPKDLTQEQRCKLASFIHDHLHDMRFEKEIIDEEAGEWYLLGLEGLAEWLEQEKLDV